MVVDPVRVCWFRWSVIVHPNPAFLVSLSQAASDLHVVVGSIDLLCGWCVCLAMRGSAFQGLLAVSCAKVHSRASLIPFVTTSFAVRCLPSKITRFQAVQMVQQIHGKILPVIPEGGRQIACLNLIMTSLKLALVAR